MVVRRKVWSTLFTLVWAVLLGVLGWVGKDYRLSVNTLSGPKDVAFAETVKHAFDGAHASLQLRALYPAEWDHVAILGAGEYVADAVRRCPRQEEAPPESWHDPRLLSQRVPPGAWGMLFLKSGKPVEYFQFDPAQLTLEGTDEKHACFNRSVDLLVKPSTLYFYPTLRLKNRPGIL